MLLDRRADVHLAKRSAADGWLIKPLDPLILQRAGAGHPATRAASCRSRAEAAERESAEEEPVAVG